MAARQITVYAFDQRGWGRSVKRLSERGLTGGTSQVLDDIDSVVKSQLPSTVPLFLMGHSMGGAEVLVSLLLTLLGLYCLPLPVSERVQGMPMMWRYQCLPATACSILPPMVPPVLQRKSQATYARAR